METINNIYESISIYRSVFICACQHECDQVSEYLINNDYSISLSNSDRSKRVLVLTIEDLPMTSETGDVDFNVLFITKQLKESINLNKLMDKFTNLSMIAFIDL